MADLGQQVTGTDSTRGQLLLLTAFILAVAFVTLALVVNSAIFTENLATRDDVAGSTDALTYRHEVTQSVGGVLEYVNENNYSSQTTLSDAARAEVAAINSQGAYQQARLGRIVDLSYQNEEFGERIAQTGGQNFTNATGDPDWQLASSVQETRNVQIEVANPGTLTEEFQVRLNDSANVWEMHVTEDAGNLSVTVNTGDGDQATCTRNVGNNATIDVTAATIDGEPCHALNIQSDGTPMWFGTGLDSDYTIAFENGDVIEGAYSLVIGPDGSANTTNLKLSPATSPYVTPAIYSLVIDYGYHTASVGYETTVRIAPGEVPE